MLKVFFLFDGIRKYPEKLFDGILFFLSVGGKMDPWSESNFYL